MAKGTELATVSPSNYALLRLDKTVLTEALAENIGPEGLSPQDLPKVTNPSGAKGMFTISGASGDEAFKALEGIIVAWQAERVWFEKAFGESSGDPPACVGHVNASGYMEGNPGVNGNKDCANCPKAEFELGPERCIERRVVLLLRENSIFPVVLTITPSGLRVFKQYGMSLSNELDPETGIPLRHWQVVSRFELEKDTSANGIEYQKISNIKMVRKLTPDECFGIAELRKSLVLPRR